MASAEDACGDSVVIDHSDVVVPGPCPEEFSIWRTWTATGECGGVAECEQVIVVTDTTPPSLVLPPDHSVSCDEPTNPVATGMASVMDDCDDAPTISFSNVLVPGACPQEWTVLRTWTGRDACNNLSEGVQTIEVVDDTPPEPTALLVPVEPAPPISAGSPCSASSRRSFVVTCEAEDACDDNPTLEARLLVTRDACMPAIEDVLVSCGEQVTIELRPPGLPDSPCSLPSVTLDSCGRKVVTGQAVVLEVTATDACGNAGVATFDPTVECEAMALGECCSYLDQPPSD